MAKRRQWTIVGVPYTFRSELEVDIAYQLLDWGGEWSYETDYVSYQQRVTGICNDCGSINVMRRRTYNPDFCVWLSSNQFFYIETKGRLTQEDRSKMIAFKSDNPDLDVRFVFEKDGYLNKQKKTKYSRWAEQKGFTYAISDIPDDWLDC
jgi:hypothetical protein